MATLQIYDALDTLRCYKLMKHKQYGCFFYEYSVNRKFNIGTGYKDNIEYKETVITDGNISLNKKNFETPIIVFKNQAFKLDTGLSIPIDIKNATFFILKVYRDNDIEYSIYYEDATEELLNKIIRYIYNHEYNLFKTESIRMLDNETIGLITNNREEIISLAPKTKKKKRK